MFPLFLASCNGSKSYSGVEFQHPIFESFNSFCLPLMTSSSGFETENVERLAKSSGLKAGAFNRANFETLPYGVFKLGTPEVGAELHVFTKSHLKKSNTCRVSYYMDDIPSPDKFTSWLNSNSSGWNMLSDQSGPFHHIDNSDLISVLYCDGSSVSLLYYGITDFFNRDDNNDKIVLWLKDSQNENCSDELKRQPVR